MKEKTDLLLEATTTLAGRIDYCIENERVLGPSKIEGENSLLAAYGTLAEIDAKLTGILSIGRIDKSTTKDFENELFKTFLFLECARNSLRDIFKRKDVIEVEEEGLSADIDKEAIEEYCAYKLQEKVANAENAIEEFEDFYSRSTQSDDSLLN